MAATDATTFPKKNTAYRVYFEIRDQYGDLVAGAATLDSERSLDGAAFADCTNETTEVAQGIYYLELTAAETNTDCTVVIVKSDQKSTVIYLYPVDNGDLPVNLTALDGDTGFADVLGKFTTKLDAAGQVDTGTGPIVASTVTGNVAGSVASVTAAVTVDTGVINQATWQADASRTIASVSGAVGSVTAGVNVDQIDGDTGAAAHLATALATDGQFTGNLSGSVASVTATVGADLVSVLTDTGAAHLDAGRLGVSATTTLDTGVVNQAVWQTDASRGITASSDTGVNERLAALETGVTVTGLSDTGVNERLAAIETAAAAVKAKTDSLTFTVAGQADSNIQSVNDTAVTGDGGSGTEWGP